MDHDFDTESVYTHEYILTTIHTKSVSSIYNHLQAHKCIHITKDKAIHAPNFILFIQYRYINPTIHCNLTVNSLKLFPRPTYLQNISMCMPDPS